MNSIDKKSLEGLREKHKEISDNPNLQKMAGEILNYTQGFSDNVNETVYRQKGKNNLKYLLR